MLADRARTYYLSLDYNCAESLLRACNDEYQMHLDENALKLASGFGKGMGAERTCGLLIVSESVLGYLFVKQRAHATPGFTELCADYLRQFEDTMSTAECSALRGKYLNDRTRCFTTVERAANFLENYIAGRQNRATLS